VTEEKGFLSWMIHPAAQQQQMSRDKVARVWRQPKHAAAAMTLSHQK